MGRRIIFVFVFSLLIVLGNSTIAGAEFLNERNPIDFYDVNEIDAQLEADVDLNFIKNELNCDDPQRILACHMRRGGCKIQTLCPKSRHHTTELLEAQNVTLSDGHCGYIPGFSTPEDIYVGAVFYNYGGIWTTDGELGICHKYDSEVELRVCDTADNPIIISGAGGSDELGTVPRDVIRECGEAAGIGIGDWTYCLISRIFPVNVPRDFPG